MSDSGRKTLGIKVLPKKEFAEQEKTSEEKIQALGGTRWRHLAAGHPCGQESRVPGNPLGVGEPVSVKDFFMGQVFIVRAQSRWIDIDQIWLMNEHNLVLS